MSGCRGRAQGVGSGRPSDFKDIDRHSSIVKSLVIHLTTLTGYPSPQPFLSFNAISKVNDPGGLLTNSLFWNGGVGVLESGEAVTQLQGVTLTSIYRNCLRVKVQPG